MALIRCPECNKQISDRADACPHCGYPLKFEFNKNYGLHQKKKVTKTQWVLSIGLGIIALAFLAK